MITLETLVESIVPEKTVLFLGAGSSMPFGGLSGAGLAQAIQTSLGHADIGDDLIEVASILERKYGRSALFLAVRNQLKDLRPSGSLLVLPEFDWHSIYTTNFDRLIEEAYRRCGKACVPVRSNYEWSMNDTPGTKLYKIHGCITRDSSQGNKGNLVLTERDYEDYAKFRETLFANLSLEMMTRDTLFIGYSLKDSHIRDTVKKIAKIKREQGALGKIFCLMYSRDEDRAMLLEDFGTQVAFGGINEFCDLLASKSTTKLIAESPREDNHDDWLLNPRIRAGTHEVVYKAQAIQPSATRMFNGRPAEYADIRNGFTFKRTLEDRLTRALRTGTPVVTLFGVSGVGKTTLARRCMWELSRSGMLAWEHDENFQFYPKQWAEESRRLAQASRRGVLLIDNSPAFQGRINDLLDELPIEGNERGLQLILIGETSEWRPRKKHPVIFGGNGASVIPVERLDSSDIDRLIDLVDSVEPIRRLVDESFRALSRAEKSRRIQQRCSSDMFVALKHLFGFDALDAIVLGEYARLNEDYQDVYRHVAALEVAGAKIHRQLVIRILGVQSHTLSAMLTFLEGIVDEYDINAGDGIYGWRTRHEVIAKIIADYKLHNQDELYGLLERVVDQINPLLWIERQTISRLCNANYGIRKLSNVERRIALYQRLIEKAPTERVPRHRLVGDLIRAHRLDEAEVEMRQATTDVGPDSPLHRYSVRLLIKRASLTPGIMNQDRQVLLDRAYDLAHEGLQKYPGDKYAYTVFAEIGGIYRDLLGIEDVLVESLSIMRSGFDKLLDPEIDERIAETERALSSVRRR